MRNLIKIYIFCVLNSFLSCHPTIEVQLNIHDPCDQSNLSTVDFVNLEMRSVELDSNYSTYWERSNGIGEFLDLPPADDVVLSISGLTSNSASEPGDALIAGTVGYYDFSRILAAEESTKNVVLGRVNEFYTTTLGETPTKCTQLNHDRRGHSATLLSDGRVFLAGGEQVVIETQNESYFFDNTEFFDPKTGRFTTGPGMESINRAYHSATLLQDGNLLIAGGVGVINSVATSLNSALLYDPESGTYAAVPMVQQRSHHTATLLEDGSVILIGGRYEGQVLTSTEIFDPITQTFSAGPFLNTARAGHSAVRIGTMGVAVIGGHSVNATLNSIEFVAPLQTQTITGPNLVTARHGAIAVYVDDFDAILVAGGYESIHTEFSTGRGLNSIEIIKVENSNPATSTMVCSALTLSAARGGAAFAKLESGEILLAGGTNGSGTIESSAELIKLTNLSNCTLSKTSLTSLSTARSQALATPLIGGDILFTGGFQGTDDALTTVKTANVFVVSRETDN
ncbi:MAG: kelch repeat-containing protein [Myxococcota bacterium]|nr:kelch repeat-containing protein [Myxococcota bacterium]